MEFVGDLSGITTRNKPNATYQSMIDGEMVYEYAIHRYNKKKTKASFRCAGCRSAIDDGRNPEFKIYYLKGAVDYESKIVRFDENPDMHPHCCERRHPFFVKGKQLRREVRNEIKGSGVTGSECIKNFNKKVKEKEEDGDHDGVMSRIGTTEALRKTLKKAAKPNFVQHCAPTDIDPELKNHLFPMDLTLSA
uniref:Uncharacterized protein n=1 Tax=Panagrolaimus superbus TaxID=310955 RepID=A0A914YS53_9BILA